MNKTFLNRVASWKPTTRESILDKGPIRPIYSIHLQYLFVYIYLFLFFCSYLPSFLSVSTFKDGRVMSGCGDNISLYSYDQNAMY